MSIGVGDDVAQHNEKRHLAPHGTQRTHGVAVGTDNSDFEQPLT